MHHSISIMFKVKQKRKLLSHLSDARDNGEEWLMIIKLSIGLFYVCPFGTIISTASQCGRQSFFFSKLNFNVCWREKKSENFGIQSQIDRLMVAKSSSEWWIEKREAIFFISKSQLTRRRKKGRETALNVIWEKSKLD